MNEARRWSVLLYDDEVNTVPGVLYVLNRVCGLSPQAAMVSGAAASSGMHEVGRYADRAPAEALAAELLAYGLNVALREV